MHRPDTNVRRLPAVDRILAWPEVAQLTDVHGRALVLEAVRDELAGRRAIGEAGSRDQITAGIERRLNAASAPSQRRVFNLTGTVLHTNLGRSPLPPEAVAAIAEVAAAASNLEYDLVTGSRGERDAHVEGRLRRLTGAPAATVVNNNAAAVLLTLNFPVAGDHGARRLQATRSGHHQSHPSSRLR